MRRLIVLTLTAMLVTLTGCGKYRDIKINDVKATGISPYGLKGVNAELAVEVDNPASLIKLSDMEAIVKYCGKVLGKVTVDPFTLEGRTVKKYDLKARVVLEDGVKLRDMLMLIDRNFKENCVVDITVKGKLRGGLSKTIVKNDVPLKKLMNYAEKKK